MFTRAAPWMSLTDILLSGARQSQMDRDCTSLLACGTRHKVSAGAGRQQQLPGAGRGQLMGTKSKFREMEEPEGNPVVVTADCTEHHWTGRLTGFKCKLHAVYILP